MLRRTAIHFEFHFEFHIQQTVITVNQSNICMLSRSNVCFFLSKSAWPRPLLQSNLNVCFVFLFEVCPSIPLIFPFSLLLHWNEVSHFNTVTNEINLFHKASGFKVQMFLIFWKKQTNKQKRPCRQLQNTWSKKMSSTKL